MRIAEQPATPEVVTVELLCVHGVARMLGRISARQVYRLLEAGRLPRPVKLGGLTRWRRAELLDWIANGCPSDCGEAVATTT